MFITNTKGPLLSVYRFLLSHSNSESIRGITKKSNDHRRPLNEGQKIRGNQKKCETQQQSPKGGPSTLRDYKKIVTSNNNQQDNHEIILSETNKNYIEKKIDHKIDESQVEDESDKFLKDSAYYKFNLMNYGATDRPFPKDPVTFWKIPKHPNVPIADPDQPRARLDSEWEKLSDFGNPQGLFHDCLKRIRDSRRQLNEGNEEGSLSTMNVPEIEEMSKTEKSIIHQIFKRIDPNKEVAPNLEFSGQFIDPYWNPFQELHDLKEEIYSEFSAFARLHSTSEAMHQRKQLIDQYRRNFGLVDPLSGIEDRSRLDTSVPKDPKFPKFQKGVPERLWDPSTLRRRALWNNNRPITWRDLHILKFFVAESGMFLPRRLTMATRRQQIRAFKAIKQAQGLGLFPLDWRPPDTEQMIVEDPLQFVTDILISRFKDHGNLRAEAMLKVMINRFRRIDFRRYFIHKSKLNLLRNKRIKRRAKQNKSDNYSQILKKYNKR